jgi:two-component system response regulator HydG
VAKLLVVDDKPNIRTVLRMILEKEGHAVQTAEGGQEGLKQALAWHPQVIICDIRMGDMDGTELFHLLRARGMDIPFIFMTAFATVRGAVTAIKDGAVDYLSKPLDYGKLKQTIASLVEEGARRARAPAAPLLVGRSLAMRQLQARIRSVAATNSTVLVDGESGAGKELVAREIHSLSPRRDGPFVPVNCSALSMSLLESELFGHEKGAFTGAVERKKGVFEIADAGTLFLDEVSEIDPATQVKLLRVLQERSFNRVGGSEPVAVDVRLIAATNRRLEELVQEGRFRDDLYYRLNVIPIHVAPLREHLEDLPALCEHLVGRLCVRESITMPQVDTHFLEKLAGHPWPGNVRELENLLERILVLHRPARLEVRHLDAELTGTAASGARIDSERQRILSALRVCGGNKTEAARVLGLPRRTLYNRLQRFDIRPEEYAPL